MAEYKGDRVGQQLGPYRLTRLLGAGGFGEVYKADHRLLQQKRAIKLLLERHFHDPNQRERFLREARTLATLEHPNILPVLEVGEESNILYLVMPFYHRGTLNDLLKQRTTPLPLIEVERALAQMCAAVGYAHARHIAHLDLKPENMLLHEDGRLVLSDFGLAHLIKQGRLNAGSSASWGTPYYMAPEQIRGEPELRSDLYALGVILYQLLTNQRPFTGNAPEAVMMKHLLEAPPPLHAASPAAPATLEPVIQKALEKKPEDRYATAEALLADFRAAVGSLSPPSAQPLAPEMFPAAPMPQMNVSAPVVQTPISVPNKAQTTATVCEVGNCGVLAIGRCSTCKRAFCGSHQAWSGRTYYIDQCAPCFAETPAEVERVKVEVERAKKFEADRKHYVAYQYFHTGSARTALLTSGVQPVDISWVKQQWKHYPLSMRHGRDVGEVIHGRGWILGKFRWNYRVVAGYHRGLPIYVHVGKGLEAKQDSGDWLTALLDLPIDESMRHKSWGLVRVHYVSEGYEALCVLGDSDYYSSGDDLLASTEEVAQTVKRLTGESS